MKIIFFDPVTNIWPHAFPSSILMDSFSNDSHEVLAVRCDSFLQSSCVAIREAGLNFETSKALKNQVCRSCKRRRDLLQSKVKADSINIEDFLELEDYNTASEFVGKVTKHNWTISKFCGIKVTQIAAYEILITNKTGEMDAHLVTSPQFLESVRNVCLTVLAARKILIKFSPDKVVVYNSLYSMNNAFYQTAKSLGISSYTIQGGMHMVERNNFLTAYESPQEEFKIANSSEWMEIKDQALDEDQIRLVESHLKGLFAGQSAFAYSLPADSGTGTGFILKLNLSSGKKKLLALMSSEDEIYAGNLASGLPKQDKSRQIFATQLEWLKWLIEFASVRLDVILIIRVHPRLFPNKREFALSPDLQQYNELFRELPSNVFVNFPSDEVSLYHLALESSVVLNYRSTAGVELLSFGIPVVIPGSHSYLPYPSELNLVAESKSDYKNKIESAIMNGWQIDNSIKAFRWYSFLFSTVAERVLVKSSHELISKGRPVKNKSFIRVWRILTFIYLQMGPNFLYRGELFSKKGLHNSPERTKSAILEDLKGTYQIPVESIFKILPTSEVNLIKSSILRVIPSDIISKINNPEFHKFIAVLVDPSM